MDDEFNETRPFPERPESLSTPLDPNTAPMAEAHDFIDGVAIAEAPSAAAALIERWFSEAIHNSPASRDTTIFNHLRAAVDDLKTRFKES